LRRVHRIKGLVCGGWRRVTMPRAVVVDDLHCVVGCRATMGRESIGCEALARGPSRPQLQGASDALQTQ